MRQYHMQETKEVTKIICNKCGKEIIVENGMTKEDTLSVQKRWGYFRKKITKCIRLICVKHAMTKWFRISKFR